MQILFIVAAIAVIGWLFGEVIGDNMMLGAVGFLAAVWFPVLILLIPVAQYETRCSIEDFKAVRIAVESAREMGQSMENAAIMQKAIDSNRWLAREQYQNNSWLDFWVDDAVDKLEPIR